MPSKNEQIGVAIFGAGNVSSCHLDAYQHDPRCKVVAIGSRTKEGAEAKAREVGIDPASIGIYDSLDDLLNDRNVDALSITTPQRYHADNVIAAAKAGKHCVVEKPIALSVAELEAMDAAVSEGGVRTVCGFVLRFNPASLMARSMIDEGLLGTVYYVQTDYWHNPEQSGYPGSENHLTDQDCSAEVLGGCMRSTSPVFSCRATSSKSRQSNSLGSRGIHTRPDKPQLCGLRTVKRARFRRRSNNGCRISSMSMCSVRTVVCGITGSTAVNLRRKRNGRQFPTVSRTSGRVSHIHYRGKSKIFPRLLIEGKIAMSQRCAMAVNTTYAILPIDRFGGGLNEDRV